MVKQYLLLFVLLFSFSLFAQEKIDAGSLNYPIMAEEYLTNKNKFLDKYATPAYDIDTVIFTKCRLIGIERDSVFKMNFYLFKDEDGIEFTLFEYYKPIEEDMKDYFAKVPSIYNLSVADMNRFFFNLKAIRPYYYLKDDMTSLHLNDPNLQKYTMSNKQLYDFWQIVGLEKTSLNPILNYINEDKVYTEVKKNKKNKIILNTDWLRQKRDKTCFFKVEKSDYQLISIEQVFDSSFLLFTFYRNRPLKRYPKDKSINSSERIKSFVYIFGERDVLEKHPELDVITNFKNRFNLKVCPIKLPQDKVYYKEQKKYYHNSRGYYIQLKSGRVLGGAKYRKLSYYLREAVLSQ